ncbi:hypothetical protein ACET3Z_015487 [Daucus carota]
MAISEAGAHILIFPYPAQGHMIPLLDLTHQLALRNLTITILVTPKNLHYLNPLLIKHPSIHPLVLPFPRTDSIPDGVENVRDLPSGGFLSMMTALFDLYHPMLNWFRKHPSPPVAIVSDIFLGWTNRLAAELNIPRYVFSPSGVLAMSIACNVWRDMPKRNDPTDENEVIKFSDIPNSPSHNWWKLSPMFRRHVEGDPQSEALKGFHMGNVVSRGFVFNSFTELERVYLDYMEKFLGHDQVWAVGPLLPSEERVGRGGANEILAGEIKSWLDQFEDATVVYVCFGSQAVLTNKQMEMLALGLEKSGARFLWSSKEPTKGHEVGEYGMIPSGFEDRVAGRGLIVRGWAPQFANADLLDELEVGTRVCEGERTLPDSDKLARLIATSVSDEKEVRSGRAKQLNIMAIPEAGAHILIIPYPAQGHMIPLLDLTHQLALRKLTITILVTPKNLHYLNQILIKHPSIQPLVLPFPPTTLIPHGVENARDLPSGGFISMIAALVGLYDPIVNWFRNHPSPPVAIISDMFFSWTNRLAGELKISRYVFSPSGILALSVVWTSWRDMPKRNDPKDENEVIKFSNIPNCPSYPWWKLSPLFRSYVQGKPQSELFRASSLENVASRGIIFNSFTELEKIYLDYLKKFLGHDRVWTVGPLLPSEEERVERGGSNEILAKEIKSWLDQFENQTVVYVCFGSQAVLTNKQMEMLALGLEKSGVRFLWSYKEPTKGHKVGEYGMIPLGFEDRVSGRGLIVKGWAPQVAILSHPALGAFLTHCGWNSVLESIAAGVPMLTWPMGVDQFTNANLLDELKVGIKVCEGEKTVPDSDELARLLASSVGDEKGVRIARAKVLSKAARDSTGNDGSSYRALDSIVDQLSKP